jgi:four helix bundle protein
MKRPHREMRVWQASIELVEAIYRFTSEFPKEETYGLANQLRRAAVSVPSNIAEGSGRRTTPELIQYLHIANGSLSEMDTQLEVSRRLGYGQPAEALQMLVDEVQSQLLAVIQSLKRRSR